MHWCATIPEKYIHSLSHLVAEIDHAFNHFDHQALNKEIMKLRKALDESIEQFYMHFCNLAYRFLEDDIDWEFLVGRFEYFLDVSKPCSTHFNNGATQSQEDIILVTSDCPLSPHQIDPPPCSDVGDHAHTLVELSHPPTLLALDICADLACKPTGCHMESFPRLPSSHSVDRLDCTFLLSSIPDSSPIVNEDQDVDRVGVMQPTYVIIHDECVQESKEELAMKGDSLPFMPHPLHPDIPCDYATIDFPYENSFMDASTSDHSQDNSDVSLSLQCGEETSSSENPFNLSFIFLENTKGQHICFSSTPLLDSSNHEDADYWLMGD